MPSTEPESPSPFWWRPAAVLFQIIVIVAIPATLTLMTVEDPGTLKLSTDDPTPLGYTWSLLLFLLPMLYLAWWFLRHPRITFQKKSFWTALAILVPLGFILDILFAHTFFTFQNTGAVTGIDIPGLGGGIPVEEFIFYITGFVFVLLLYIWCDEYWMAAYNRSDYATGLQESGKILKFHKESVILAVVLLALAVIYKKLISGTPGFPLYYTYLLLASFVPSAGFYLSVRKFINWRAFSFAFLLVMLISLMWEATLASPYGWWGYKHQAMTGIFIGAWSQLPVEAVFVWLAVTFTTVIIYEVVKLWQASGRSLKEALVGAGED